MDKGVTLLLRQLVRVIAGLVEHVSGQNHLGAVALGAVYLHERRGGGHHDHSLYTGQLGGVGHALGVVARGGGDQALGLLVLGQGADLIIGASHLVSAGILQVFRLEIHLVSRLG